MSNTADCTELERLMCINVGDSRLRERGELLLIGSCMNSRFPDIANEFKAKNEGNAVLHVCLEETHVNQAGFKIASIIRYSKISKVTVLTIDGSPHCVQLHFVVEDIKKHFTSEVEIEHYVVERGEALEVPSAVVKRARHLSKISL
ncbi:MAG: 4Fe-4S ferredoxin [Candidatus Thorarchaeota archaeon]|nr:4Fe-4S ferredoxin [Candidatus Thorarchaeota archaeon]